MLAVFVLMVLVLWTFSMWEIEGLMTFSSFLEAS